LLREFRARARHVVGPVLGICAVGYFTYHAVNGDRGFLALLQLKQKVAAATEVTGRTSETRRRLQHRVRLLYSRSLDPDMLEERARRVLNYGYPEDMVILDAPPRRGKAPKKPPLGHKIRAKRGS